MEEQHHPQTVQYLKYRHALGFLQVRWDYLHHRKHQTYIHSKYQHSCLTWEAFENENASRIGIRCREFILILVLFVNGAVPPLPQDFLEKGGQPSTDTKKRAKPTINDPIPPKKHKLETKTTWAPQWALLWQNLFILKVILLFVFTASPVLLWFFLDFANRLLRSWKLFGC